MSKRGHAFKIGLYAVLWLASIVLLVTGWMREPIVFAQVAVFPVLALMNYDGYRRAAREGK